MRAGIVLYEILDGMRIREKKDDEEWYTLDRVLTDDEIIEKWEKNGEDARNRGTEAHLQMELWLNSEPVRLDDGEVIVGLDFEKLPCANRRKSVPHRVDNIRGGRECRWMHRRCADHAGQLPLSRRLETVGETGGQNVWLSKYARAAQQLAGL